MTKQLNVVAHKIKLFKAPLPPPRHRMALGNAHQERPRHPSRSELRPQKITITSEPMSIHSPSITRFNYGNTLGRDIEGCHCQNQP